DSVATRCGTSTTPTSTPETLPIVDGSRCLGQCAAGISKVSGSYRKPLAVSRDDSSRTGLLRHDEPLGTVGNLSQDSIILLPRESGCQASRLGCETIHDVRPSRWRRQLRCDGRTDSGNYIVE